MEHNAIHRLAAILAFLGMLGFAGASMTGCGAGPNPVNADDPFVPDDPFDDPGPSEPPGGGDLVDAIIVGDEAFANARLLGVRSGSTQSFDGEIISPTATEVYDIGPVITGERLIITVDPAGSLDPVLGVFDSAGSSIMINDDRDYYGGDFSSRINVQPRRDSAACFVAVSASFQTNTRGRYTLTVTRSGVEAIREPEPQVVYLNFDGGGPLVIGRRPPVILPAFEESELAESFEGRIDELIATIVDHVRDDYDGLSVEVVSSREAPEPNEPHTTIHFGAYDPGLLGIADYVDEFNAAQTQKAIVYVDTFTAFLPLGPSLEEMAAALANTASHETGHLLGLNHTADPHDLMDITAGLRQMLADQSFGRSPLHREVFPIGHQDNARLLVDAVGGDLAKLRATRAARRVQRPAWYDEGDPTPARLDRPLSSCLCESCVKHSGVR